MSAALVYSFEDLAGFDASNDNVPLSSAAIIKTPTVYRRDLKRAIDQSYSYDARGKVTSIIDGAVSGNNRSFDYDGLGRLTSASGPWGANGTYASGSFKYDPLNNLRQKKLGSRTVTLTYDKRNRLTQSIDTGPSGLRTLAYDAQGNVTTLGNLGFIYDYSDQPVVVSGTANPGSGAANGSYTYDGNLKRVKSVVNGKTIYNVYDASGKLVHVEDQNPSDGGAVERTDYLSAGGRPIVRMIAGQAFIYEHSDHLGSPVATTSQTGAIISRERYTPFGETLDNPEILDNQGGFTGHIKDKATGLNYMQARYYDPVIGRFLSIDPVTFMDQPYPQQFNRYAYTWNDPINANDPDGEFVNFVAKFVVDVGLEVAIQAASGQKINVGSALKSSAKGVLDPTKTVRKAAKLAKLGNAARKARKGCCFVAGTLVETDDGLRPIEEIELGDLVLSRNPETGETTFKAVTDVIPEHNRVIWEVSLTGENGTSELFETTDEHPWWVVNEIGKGNWKRTDELTDGMVVTTADNQIMTIVSVINTERVDGTYNLTVADFETYFVGRNKVLVHNCKKNVTGKTKVGDNVKTFENSPEDFTNVGGGRFKDKKTGFIQTKSKSSHPPRPGGEIKSGAKKGEAPRPGKKITITGGAKGGCVLRKTGC